MMQRDGILPELLPFDGVGLVRVSEPTASERPAEATLKELTSGEPLEIRVIANDVVCRGSSDDAA